jgi:hypothetical protein
VDGIGCDWTDAVADIGVDEYISLFLGDSADSQIMMRAAR